MAGESVAPAAQGTAVLEASPGHPLDSLGLDTNATEGPSLLAALGDMPGAAQAAHEREAMAGQAFARQEQPYVQPQAVPQQPQPAQVNQFNQALEQGHTGPAQPGVQQAAPAAPAEPEQPSYATQADYDFLVGLLQDQSEAIGAMQNAPAAPMAQDPFVAAPVAPAPTQPQTVQGQPQIPPIAVPQLTPVEISESEFESIQGDRTAFASFLAKRDQATAANVTQQLASTILPHVQGFITKEATNQRAISQFMAANPDLAEHPDALEQAVVEARQVMPYAKPERILYYAARTLRGAMATNQQIESNVHDLRSNERGRRAPVINNPAQLRRGPGNEPQTNPYDDLQKSMIQLRKNEGGILAQMGIG